MKSDTRLPHGPHAGQALLLAAADTIAIAADGLNAAEFAARKALAIEPDAESEKLRDLASDLSAEAMRVINLALSLRAAAEQLSIAAQLLEGEP